MVDVAGKFRLPMSCSWPEVRVKQLDIISQAIRISIFVDPSQGLYRVCYGFGVY